jgi:hypothetical protein
MTWAVTAAVGGALVGGYFANQAADTQAGAAQNAANAQADANRYAADIQKQIFERQVELQEPWRKAGENALTKLTGGIESGQFGKVSPFSFTAAEFAKQQDPGYAFRLAEGNKLLNQSAAARGGLISGNALKAAQRYGQEMGSQEFQNAYNRALTGYNANQAANALAYNQLAGVSGTGQTSAQQVASQAGQYGANVGSLASQTGQAQANALTSAANARASAYQGYGSAIGQGLQGLYNNRNAFNFGGGYQLGTGTLGNAYAVSQGYEPLNYGGYVDGYGD